MFFEIEKKGNDHGDGPENGNEEKLHKHIFHLNIVINIFTFVPTDVVIENDEQDSGKKNPA